MMKRVHFLIATVLTTGIIWGLLQKQFEDPILAVVIGIISWVTMLFYWFMKPYILQGISLIVALSLGCYGYWKYIYIGDSNAVLNSIYSTIRLFILDVDIDFGPEGYMYVDLPLSLEIARWSAAFYTISTISLLMLRYFGQSLKGLWQRLKGGHIIIYGYNKKSSILIENLTSEGYQVTAIANTLTTEERQRLIEKGIPAIVTEAAESSWYIKSGLARAEYVVLFHEDDSVNLDTYISIKEYLSTKSMDHKLNVLIHLNYPKSQQIYHGLIQEDEKNVRSDAFSIYELITEKMLKESPLYKGYENQLREKDGSPLHILFVGFGKMNQQIAYEALNLSHFTTAKKIHLTVMDKEIEKVKKDWGYLAKYAEEVADMKFMKVDLDSQSLKDELDKITMPITHVFLSLKDDYQDMIEGFEMIEALPDTPIFIKMNDERSVSNWLHNHEKEFSHVKRYAHFHEVLNSEYILKEKLRKLAESAHENYQKQRIKQGLSPIASWDELDSFKQESTRYQMLHNDTKLMLLGLKKVPLTDESQKDNMLTEEQFATHITSFVDTLAEVEHRRWNAFHYLRGWQEAKDKNIDKKELEKRKLHKYLVEWDRLDEDIKKYDRDSILYLQVYYEAQGYGLVKI